MCKGILEGEFSFIADLLTKENNDFYVKEMKLYTIVCLSTENRFEV